MEYEVAFEIKQHGLGVLWFPLMGLLMACFGYVFIGYVSKKSVATSFMRSFVGFFRMFFVSFSLLWAVGAYIAVGPSQSKLRKNYEEGVFQVVEGIVEDFNSNPSGRYDNEMESFRVNDQVFEYNYFEPSPGFKHTAYHGGPVKEGMQVRVSYVGDVIVKLEVLVRANK